MCFLLGERLKEAEALERRLAEGRASFGLRGAEVEARPLSIVTPASSYSGGFVLHAGTCA